jgi:hypothetical protein
MNVPNPEHTGGRSEQETRLFQTKTKDTDVNNSVLFHNVLFLVVYHWVSKRKHRLQLAKERESLRESDGENLIDILTTGSFSYLNRLDVEFRGESENEKKKTKKSIS